MSYDPLLAPERSLNDAEPTFSFTTDSTKSVTIGSTQSPTTTSTHVPRLTSALTATRRRRKLTPKVNAAMTATTTAATTKLAEVEMVPRKPAVTATVRVPIRRQPTTRQARDSM